MNRLLAKGTPRLGSRFSRAERKMLNTRKEILVEALRGMPTICPPRVAVQSKANLQRIVDGALYRGDADPIRLAMQTALANARLTLPQF